MLPDYNTVMNMSIARERFGIHSLKAEIAMTRSGSPFDSQRLGKMHPHINKDLTKIPVAKDRMATNCSRWCILGRFELIKESSFANQEGIRQIDVVQSSRHRKRPKN
jgi:hypothetical protein